MSEFSKKDIPISEQLTFLTIVVLFAIHFLVLSNVGITSFQEMLKKPQSILMILSDLALLFAYLYSFLPRANKQKARNVELISMIGGLIGLVSSFFI